MAEASVPESLRLLIQFEKAANWTIGLYFYGVPPLALLLDASSLAWFVYATGAFVMVGVAFMYHGVVKAWKAHLAHIAGKNGSSPTGR